MKTEGKVLVFALGGPLFFGMAKAISRQHAVLPNHKVLIMDFTDVPFLGVSSSLALEKLILDIVHADHIISTRKTALEQAAIAMKQGDETDANGQKASS